MAGWAKRLASLVVTRAARAGSAIHSVRAVPAAALTDVAAARPAGPIHVHLSEQRAENEACLEAHGLTRPSCWPGTDFSGPDLTAVHATHLVHGGRRPARRRTASTSASVPPPNATSPTASARPGNLVDAGCRLSVGSDSHAVIDLIEEARAVGPDQRLRNERRGRFSVDDLLTMATANGHAALGWPDAGRIEPGARADLVTVRLDTVRTAGHDPEQVAAAVLFGAVAADVNDVICDGRRIVEDGRHLLVPDVARELATAIENAWRA